MLKVTTDFYKSYQFDKYMQHHGLPCVLALEMYGIWRPLKCMEFLNQSLP